MKNLSTYELLSDKELIHEIIINNKAFLFSILYKRHYRNIYNQCKLLLKNNQEASDVTQNIVLKLYHYLSSFENKSSFSTWIYRITYNECIDHLRKVKKNKFNYSINDEQYYAFNELLYEKETDDEDNEGESLKELHLKQLNILIDSLNEKDQLVIQLKYLQRQSIKQIASLLNLSESAVKMRLKRAKEKLHLIHLAPTYKFSTNTFN